MKKRAFQVKKIMIVLYGKNRNSFVWLDFILERNGVESIVGIIEVKIQMRENTQFKKKREKIKLYGKKNF